MNSKLILIFIIGILISCSTKENKSNNQVSFPDKKEKIQKLTNSSFRPVLNEKSFDTYKIFAGKNIVVTYEKNGTTIADYDDYDAFYKEILIFEVDPKSIKEKVYKDTQLEKLKCFYIYRVSAEKPYKKVIKVNKGTIKITKKLNDLNFEVNIDSDFKYGGYFEKKESKKISFIK